jgi:CBS domain-containing protein
MTVAAVLRAKGSAVVSVRPDTTVAEAAAIISERRIGAVVVLDGETGALAGILSERDVVRGLTRHGADLMALRVEALMTRDVQVATPETSVTEAMEIMDGGYFRHLPVVGRDGAPCGVVSIRDLVRHRITAQQGDVETLQAYVMGRGYGIGALS